MERSAPQPLHIPVRSRLGDGTITGHLLQPEVSPRGVVTIHPATATPERFYFSFADALVDRGFAVVTYRMRGVGSPAARTNPRLRMSDWITEDVPAVSAWTEERFPGLPQFALGHSLGGHALLLGFGGERLSGIVTVATHRAATRDIITRTERMRVRAILSALGPALTRLLGYAPGERLGLGEDIPRAALLEWSHWVSRPDYFFDIPELSAAARMARMLTPVLSVGAADDLWASPGQIDELVDRLLLAPVERRTFNATEFGVRKIGHHGLMRRSVGSGAWPEIIGWLARAADARAADVQGADSQAAGVGPTDSQAARAQTAEAQPEGTQAARAQEMSALTPHRNARVGT
ncbi:alpha/beta hydrolase family protein [Brevibacterium oceani]|uniref:alpha/beta hydrolase family protein n=1 Tax=Brevibacterium oceani TaxID=358099 RepID=UPI0015E67F5D|nr:alpha/beta hydrolase [Brevibacterium oceani]